MLNLDKTVSGGEWSPLEFVFLFSGWYYVAKVLIAKFAKGKSSNIPMLKKKIQINSCKKNLVQFERKKLHFIY